jgi:hypothetical protein
MSAYFDPSALPRLSLSDQNSGTRLTNAFSKKAENHRAAVGLHLAHYNFVRQHKTLRVTPAMAAGVSDRMWSLE